MATIWRSHQVCERCGWAGVTSAHRLNVVNAILYAIAAFVVLVLEGAEVIDLRHSIKWPVAAAALFWFVTLPRLIWQTNACGGCRQRMVAKLLPGLSWQQDRATYRPERIESALSREARKRLGIAPTIALRASSPVVPLSASRGRR